MLQKTYDRICRIVLSLLVVGLFCFFALSLISFHPSDPPSTLVWPNSHQVQNYMGGPGAGFAQWMYTIFGLSVWYLLIGAAYHTTRYLAGCHARYPYLRFAGWCFSVLGVCGFVQIAFPHAFPDILIGSGGFVGATMSGFLAPTGTIFSLLGTIAITLFGWVLYSDYAIPRLTRWVVRQLPRKNVRTFLPWLQTFFHFRSGWNRSILRKCDPPTKSFVRPGMEHEAILMKKGGKTLIPSENVSLEYRPSPSSKKPSVIAESLKVEKNDLEISIHPPQAVVKREENVIQETFPEKETEYVFPSLELLDPAEVFNYREFEAEAANRARHLEEIVQEYGFRIRVREIQLGPVITQYQVELESGLRVAKIASLADDLAVKLGVSNVRIVFPLLGKKNLVGIEIPNVKKQWVRLREVMEELAGTYTKKGIPIFLGKDVAGKSLMTDLTELPHLLIAGRTGTGKSVCLNSIITSILMTRSPREVRMVMIDPKMVELSQYKTIPHLMHPVVTDMKKAEAILAWAVEKMEDRYQWLARAGVRHVNTYNKLSKEELYRRIQPLEGETVPEMPYIVIVADEMADMMMTAPKEVEWHIIRLAQKSRAVGIHLILATQKPIVSVITSLIKSNLPARIAFQVSSKTDSRVVLDENGADRLLGHGDMLFLLPGTSTLVRAQGTFLSDDEINRVVTAISTEKPQFDDEIEKHVYGNTANSDLKMLAQKDELYIAAIDIIVREKRGSISLLQRMLGIGYGRAARLIDYMEEDGIVGPFCGYTKPREVLLSIEEWEAKQASGNENASATTSLPSAPSSSSNLSEALVEDWKEDFNENLEKEPWEEDFSESDSLEFDTEGSAVEESTEDEDDEDDEALIEKYLRRPQEEEKKRSKKDRRRRIPDIEKIRMSDCQETDEILRQIEPNQPPPFLEDGRYQKIQ